MVAERPEVLRVSFDERQQRLSPAHRRRRVLSDYEKFMKLASVAAQSGAFGEHQLCCALASTPRDYPFQNSVGSITVRTFVIFCESELYLCCRGL